MPSNFVYIRAIILGLSIFLLMHGSNDIRLLYDKNKLQIIYFEKLISQYETELCPNTKIEKCPIYERSDIARLRKLLNEHQIDWQDNKEVRWSLSFIVLALWLMIGVLTYKGKKE